MSYTTPLIEYMHTLSSQSNTKESCAVLPLRRGDIKYTVAMVVLDILAPILLMLGLKYSPDASASLLNNFEIVATAVIALVVFGEAVGKRLWVAIALITLSSILLTLDTTEGFSFSLGSLFVLGATIGWGIENNCTRQIADKDLGSGLGALVVALVIG